MIIREGQSIDGLYKITKPYLNRGAAGEIHLAENPSGNRVVLKFILEGGIVKNLNQFKQEYQTLLKFSHPNVARVHHFGEYGGNFFIVYDYVEGKQFAQVTFYWPAEQMVPLFIQALEGLQAIHTGGMLHLDIKSSNILVTSELRVKIIDFGLAQAIEKASAKKIVGSPQYIAPELALHINVDPRADIFSMGCLMYKCASGGRYPFLERGEFGRDFQKLRKIIARESLPPPPSEFGSQVPQYLDDIILKCLEHDPSRRFGSVRAVINALKTRHPEDYQETSESLGSYLVPEGNRHVGREKELHRVRASLAELLKRKQPNQALFWIRGKAGMGKSHFLRKIKEQAEKNTEKLSIHYLELPKDILSLEKVDHSWLEEWMLHLQKRIAENQKPILVLVDNFVPTESLLNIIRGLVDLIQYRTVPVMLCLTGEKIMELGDRFVEIILDSFSKRQIEEFLKSAPAFKIKTVPPEWIRSLHTQTGGSPKELKEILMEKDSRGVLFDLNGDILVAHAEDSSLEISDAEQIPTHSKARLSGLFLGLSELERLCLQWLAVWFWQEMLTSIPLAALEWIAGHSHLLPALQMLVSKGLLIHDVKAKTYSFPKYSFLPACLYEDFKAEPLQSMHHKIAEYLKLKPVKVKNFADAILFHQANGPMGVNALRSLLRLTRRYLYEEGNALLVKKLLEKTIASLSNQESKLFVFLCGKLIEACYYAGDYKKAERFYQKSLAVLQKQKKPTGVLATLLHIAILPVLIESNQFSEAEKITDADLAALKNGSKSHLTAIILNHKARLLYKRFYLDPRGDHTPLGTAKEIYEKSEELESLLHPHQQALIRNNDLGIVLHTLGENQKASGKLTTKIKRLQKNPHLFVEYLTCMVLTEIFRFLQNYRAAFNHAIRAMALAQKTKLPKWIQHSHAIMACIHQARGMTLRGGKKAEARKEFALAMKENNCALAATACLENREEAQSSAVFVFIRKGQCCQELGDIHSAIMNFEAVLHYKTSQVYHSLACLGLGECYAELGNTKEAGAYLTKAKQGRKQMPEYMVKDCELNILKAEAKCLAADSETSTKHAGVK